MAINFNPSATLTGINTFQTESQGYIQGAFMDDPVARMWVLQGLVASTVTQPVWGGIPITESIASLASSTLQTAANPLTIPSTIAGITGFTVFNRAHNMLITPGNPVPQATSGMSVGYARLGSNLRIPVSCTSTLATALENGAINQQVAWDFVNNQLLAYTSGIALPVKVLHVNANSKVVTYNSTTGALSWTYGYAALIQI